MNRSAGFLCATLLLAFTSQSARADWGTLRYGGQQPWWNPIGWINNHRLSPEEQRLQRFWHDYYNAQIRYYQALERVDWVAYHKNHGYRINGGGGSGCGMGMGCGQSGCGQNNSVQYAPVVVTPSLQWATPGGASCAPSAGPGGPGCGAPGMSMGSPMGYPGMGMGMSTGMPAAYGYGMPQGYPQQSPSPIAPAGYYYGQ